MKRRVFKVAAYLVIVAMLMVTLQYVVQNRTPVVAGEIGTFTSYEELKQFVKVDTHASPAPPPPSFGSWMGRGEIVLQSADSASSSTPDYSATNIQVDGVDEADIVKTDGQYLYIVSGNRIIVIQAYPPGEARILSEIELEGMPTGIFINGDRMVVFEGVVYYDVPVVSDARIMPYWSSSTSVKVYDVSDRENPSLQKELSSNGNYVSSRMIGDYVYLVLSEPVYEREGEVRLPVISLEDEQIQIPAEDIYYCDIYDQSYSFTSIIAINMHQDEEEPAVRTILLGASSNLYVSHNNIYLTLPLWDRERWDSRRTIIHRIEIDGNHIDYVASGEVPGRVLNQFSMDEYEGYFRIATTTGQQTLFGWRAWVNEGAAFITGRDPTATSPSLNHLYVLDMDLDIVGRLENLAPTERIFSARFMGNRAYLVTFEIIDPLFVIDLKDPFKPELLGELKITGYSDYLHPYGENHLIGIGKETVEEENGDFSWMQGVKLTLFDVTDVNNPRTVEELEIGDRGSDTPVSWDPKAFLFDRARNLMVLPVLVAEIDEADYPGGVPDWAWGRPVWQGAYVFHVSLETGFTLRGGITHVDEAASPGDDYRYYWSPFSVTRSLYIGDILFTISGAKLMMNSLDDLTFINKVELPHSTRETRDYEPEEPWFEEPGSVEPFPGEDPDDRDSTVSSPDG